MSDVIKINILKDGKSILQWFDSAKISMSDSSYCFTLDLSLNSLEIWDWFDPEKNKGELCLKVLIGNNIYEFLCEERSVPIDIEGTVFSVWGRSKQALLDKPYSKIIKDTSETTHLWQTQNATVTAIIQDILTTYCPANKPTVTWNVEDYLIKAKSFSVSERSPIEVISSLADVIGAQLVPLPDGNLSIETYKTSGSTIVADFNDFDHIVSLNEETQHSFGHNAITITGAESDVSNQLSYEVLEAEEEEQWEINKPRTVRVYYHHVSNLAPVAMALSGASVSGGSSGTVSTTENVVLIWGVGNTSKFNQEGKTDVKGSDTIPLAIQSVTYSTKYKDFSVSVSNDDENYVLFYFEDKTASSLLTITANVDEDSIVCSSMVVESSLLDEDKTKFKVKIYGNKSLIKSAFDVGGQTVSIPSSGGSEIISEFIVFQKGKATSSKPINTGFSCSFPGSASFNPSVTYGTNQLKLSGCSKEYIGAFIQYTTNYYSETYTIPNIYLLDTEKYSSYSLYFETNCGYLTASVSTNALQDEEQNCSDIDASFNGTTLVVHGDYSLITKIYDQIGQYFSVSFNRQTKTIKEKIIFTNGTANLSNTYWDGSCRTLDGYTIKFTKNSKTATISEKTKSHVAEVSYTTAYGTKDFPNAKSGYVVFLVTKCGNTLSVTVSNEDKTKERTCFPAALAYHRDWEETSGVETLYNAGSVPSATERIFHFVFNGDPSIIKSKFCSSGNEVSISATGVGYWEDISEVLTFTDGVANLSFPMFQDLTLTPTTFNPSKLNGFTCEQYSKEITLDEPFDKYMFATAQYKSYYYDGSVSVPTTYSGEFTVYVQTVCGELLSLSTNIVDLFSGEYRRVTLNIADYTSEVAVGSAKVYIDGNYRGTTSTNGVLIIPYLQTGDHTIRIVAPGYQDSDDDELANETFTVE